MAKKNFDEERKVPEPHEVTLGGVTFRLHGLPPAGAFLDGTEFRGLAGIVEFLRKIVLPADREAFESILTGEGVLVTEQDIADLSNWYVGVVGRRPTNGSKASAPGPGSTKATSEERSRSRRRVGASKN